MRRYETIFVCFSDLPSDEMQSLIERYGAIVQKGRGLVVRIDIWGKRRLAYPIQKRSDGFYVLINYVSESAVVSELERNLRIDDRILRHQTVKLADTVDMAEIEREIDEKRQKEEALVAETAPVQAEQSAEVNAEAADVSPEADVAAETVPGQDEERSNQ
ncbi:MAG: 30S ribosomal protein S6 [Deltaproteobacteria bacterium]|nr:30S ribosomal protein S6 [Deltaproteobacteria bacterium]